jgi:hypothetical protein
VGWDGRIRSLKSYEYSALGDIHEHHNAAKKEEHTDFMKPSLIFGCKRRKMCVMIDASTKGYLSHKKREENQPRNQLLRKKKKKKKIIMIIAFEINRSTPFGIVEPRNNLVGVCLESLVALSSITKDRGVYHRPPEYP